MGHFAVLSVLAVIVLGVNSDPFCPSASSGRKITSGWQLDRPPVNQSTCCSMCSKGSACDAWSWDGKSTCQLRTLWKDAARSVSNMRGSCEGRVNTALASSSHRFVGDKSVAASAEECCKSCSANALCEGWQFKDNQCELKHFSENASSMIASFAPGNRLPPAMHDAGCSVISNYRGKGQRIAFHRLYDLSESGKDTECCEHCSANPQCEFWIRSTQNNKCYLHRDFHPVNFYDHGGWRTGFKARKLAEPVYCKVIKFVWMIAGKILRRIKFNIGQALENAHIDLPTELECGELTLQDNKLKGMLSNMTIAGHMTVNKVKALGNININVTMHIRSSPSFELDFGACKTNNLKAGLWDIGLAIRSYGDYASFLTRLISGGMYANLRQQTCEGDFVAFPAEMIHGKPIETFQALNGSTQEELNSECCRKCLENTECEGFVQRMLPKRPWCSLHKFSELNEKYHGNFQQNNLTIRESPGTFMHGVQTDKVLVWGVTQKDRDAACQRMCASADNCQMWSMSTQGRECTLMTGIAKQGTVQAFRWIVNGIVDGLLNRLLGKSKFLCDNSVVHRILELLQYLENRSVDISGGGHVSVDVPDSFWETADLSNSGFANWTFPSVSEHFNISSPDKVLQVFVDQLASQIKTSFSEAVIDQFGTGIPLSVGRFIRACVENGNACPTEAPTAPAGILMV